METVRFTPAGRTLAHEGLQKLSGKRRDDARRLLLDTFRSIERDPETSADERLLASVGRAWAAGDMPDAHAVAVRRVMLQTLAGSLGGPVGCVLAQATLEAIKDVSPSHARAMLLESFRALESQSPILARFGREAAAGDIPDKEAVAVRKQVMQALTEPRDDPPVVILADISVNIADVTSAQAGRAALLTALKQIQVAGDEKQQGMALLGQQIASGDIPDRAAVALRRAVMDVLRNPGEDPSPLLLARAAAGAVDAPNVGDQAGRSALRQTFQALAKEPEATPHQRILADLGLKAAAGDISDRDGFALRRTCLKHLMERPVGSPAKAVAAACLEASEKVGAGAARAMLRTGLELIANNGNQEQKELARQGIDWGAGDMPDRQAVEVRLEQMRAVLAAEVDVEAHVETLAEGLETAPGGIERDEAEVDINGFLVSVNQEHG